MSRLEPVLLKENQLKFGETDDNADENLNRLKGI